MNANQIDVNPEYQREVVWTADRMSQLIDSLMENFYIPPIIFNRRVDKYTSEAILVCVDGKQRLSSVKAFVQGLIPCQDHLGNKWWFCNAHVSGRNKNILSETAKQVFLNKDFVTFEYTNLQTEQEEDLFARVQMGMPLSAAEKMRAQSGPWQELARCFCNDFAVIYSLQKDRMRAKDFQLTLACFSQILEVQYPTSADGIPIVKMTHTHLPKLLQNTNALDDDTKSHLASVWKTFQDLINLDPNTFNNGDKRLKGVQTFAPVEMVAVTVLISVHAETRNNRLLLEDVRELRDDLRRNFTDLRTNGYLWKAIWQFVDNLDKNRPADDGEFLQRDVSRVAPSKSTPVPSNPSGPKKGRPTARTKPLAVLPRIEQVGDPRIKSEPTELELDASDPGSRKRPRIQQSSAATTVPASNPQDMAIRPTLAGEAHKPSLRADSNARMNLRGPTLSPHRIPSTNMSSQAVPVTPLPNQAGLSTKAKTMPPLPSSTKICAQVNSQPGTKASTADKPKQKKTRTSIPQYDGAIIDLTDDEPQVLEKERANLLSAFRKKHNA